MDSDNVPRGHITQVLEACSPEIFRYLWMSYSDPLKCPLETCRRLRRDPGLENRPDQEVIGLIIGYGRRW